jgi:hypothetical protein
MKNLLKTTIYILAFAIGGVIFQISCSNDENQTQQSVQINKVVFVKGVGSDQTIWICNYDGSDLSQIPISLPNNVVLNSNNGNSNPRLSPDGQTIFFNTYNMNDQSYGIYRSDISGNSIQEIYNNPLSGTTNNLVLISSVN